MKNTVFGTPADTNFFSLSNLCPLNSLLVARE